MSSSDIVLSWSGVAKSYGRRALFSGLSGELCAGRRLVVTGANGSGKSTFLKITAGLLCADRGEVVRPKKGRVGYCAPSLELYGDLTGRENLTFFAGVQGAREPDIDAVLTTVGLSKASHKLYISYSSGMKQRLKLAFALLNKPSLLILDEPTLALDSFGVRMVDDLLESHRVSGGAALIASNDEAESLRWADQRLVIGEQDW
jgi:ABC-type multidrug transport system ATPase subunit